jgi:hypothetical protein
MLDIDENDPFTGSPRSKFFDVILNGNRGVVENVLENFLERYAAMELMLTQNAQLEEIQGQIKNILYTKQDAVNAAKTDLYITLVGDVLTQHE